MAIPIPWDLQHRRQGGDIEKRWRERKEGEEKEEEEKEGKEEKEEREEEKRYKERHWCVFSVMLPETVQYSAATNADIHYYPLYDDITSAITQMLIFLCGAKKSRAMRNSIDRFSGRSLTDHFLREGFFLLKAGRAFELYDI